MTSLSVSIVEPKYRHLFPLAPDVAFRISGNLGTKTGPAPVLLSTTSNGGSTYVLPPLAAGASRESASLWVVINDIVMANSYKIVGYNIDGPEWSWEQFEYDNQSNSITFFNPPPNGQMIEVYERQQVEAFLYLAMPDYVLVQGAREFPTPRQTTGEPTPEPTKFPDGVTVNPVEILRLPLGADGQFLGGFQCELEILSPAAQGTARISDDKLGFDYQPPFGWIGRDSFAYRVVTPFGQQSDAACVQIYVGV